MQKVTVHRPSRRGDKTVFWDFHGTLADDPGGWQGALIEVLDRYLPGHSIDREELRPFLRSGFPWHRPERHHPELSSPDAWWENLEPLFANAYEEVGIQPARTRELAREVRTVYVRPERQELFDHAIQSLESLRTDGWRQVILSNHAPELPEIVDSIGLSGFFDVVITSAATGFEKPNRRAFEIALEAAGNPDVAWMVGDNPEADVLGAERVGIPAILVRKEDPRCSRVARDLRAVLEMIREAGVKSLF
ncbi:MAG: HAD family hydrolase [Chloroflexi bacterium]|nr:HAD family hydrolase [Chloroflexota bacterium]